MVMESFFRLPIVSAATSVVRTLHGVYVLAHIPTEVEEPLLDYPIGPLVGSYKVT